MIHSNELILEPSLESSCKERDNQADIILKIFNLAKKLNYCNYEVAEKVRFANHLDESDIENIRKKLDYCFWVDTLNKYQVEKFLTATDKEKLFEELEKKTPVFNIKNVNETIESFRCSKNARASEMISKVYNSITDSIFRLGNKQSSVSQKRLQKNIPMCFRLTVFYGTGGELPSYISSNNSNFNIISDLERALYLTDGKTQPDYNESITSIVDEALTKNEKEVNSKYFTIKIFKNGNVKIKIKSQKILDRFNRWGRKKNTLE